MTLKVHDNTWHFLILCFCVSFVAVSQTRFSMNVGQVKRRDGSVWCFWCDYDWLSRNQKNEKKLRAYTSDPPSTGKRYLGKVMKLLVRILDIGGISVPTLLAETFLNLKFSHRLLWIAHLSSKSRKILKFCQKLYASKLVDTIN